MSLKTPLIGGLRKEPMESASWDIAKWRSVFGRLFDGHAAQMALLDLKGFILETNAAWRLFGRENGLANSYDCVGRNYLEACESAAAANVPGAREAYLGLLEVIHTRRPKFTMMYPCHAPGEKRTFRIWVEPQLPSAPVIIIAHFQISSPEPTQDVDGAPVELNPATQFNLLDTKKSNEGESPRKTMN